LILYSKKEGIGYRSPLGDTDEGSEVFLSTIGCLVVNGIDGFPALITFGTAAVVVEKFIFCIGSNLFRGSTILSALGRTMPFHFYYLKNSTRNSAVLKCLFISIEDSFSRTFSSNLRSQPSMKKFFANRHYGTVL